MKSVLSILMALLLVLLPLSETAVSKQYPEGWDSGNEAHPWGGDESPTGGDEGSDSFSSGSYRSATISATGWLPLDMLLYKFLIKIYPQDETKSGAVTGQATSNNRSDNSKTVQR